jgi:ABC-type transport system involved in multi-copper enzyme maturation permease subunit
VQVLLVTFIGPAFTAGAVSGERERQTFDLLRTTLLSADSFVLGKLISALSYTFLLVLVSIPLQSIAFLLGGLSPVELILSEVLILVAAVTYALYGLWCSAAMRSTLAATVATFAGMLFIIFGIPMLALAAGVVLGVFSGVPTLSGPFVEIILIYGGLALAATNLPATLIISEIFLLQQNALMAFTQLIDGRTVWIFSPWILFIIFHAIAAIILYSATVRRVRRVSDV